MCLSPIRTKKGYIVPCGKCVECLSQKRNDWSVRLYYEMQKYSTPPAFVTLTYDDDHLPTMVDEDTGELVPVVSKRDLQLFFKRLRKRVPGIRYFFCTEYGPTTNRPHAHGIIFNLPQKYFSLYLRCCTDDLNKLIFDCWQNGFTSAYLAKPAAIHYCTKYCLTDNVLKNDRIVAPFTLSSINLGSNFFDTVDYAGIVDLEKFKELWSKVHCYLGDNDLPDEFITKLTRVLANLEPYLIKTRVSINGHIRTIPRYYRRKAVGSFDDPMDTPYTLYYFLKDFRDYLLYEKSFGDYDRTHDTPYYELLNNSKLKVLKDRYTKKSKL